ncbi:MAG: cohesin domain-containing protein [Saprospiraceae bacterium]
MKKSLLLLWCCLSAVSFTFALNNPAFPPGGSPRIVLTADTNTVLIGSQLCIKVLSYGFQDIDSLQLSIIPGGVTSQFDNLRQSPSNTGIAQYASANGYLNITWKNATPGAALPDGSVLFEICVKGLAAGESGLHIVNYPTFVKAFSNNGQVQELAYNADDWRFTYYVFPEESIALAITDTVVVPNEQICLRVEVSAFDKSLVGMQFGIKWDPKMLQFKQVLNGDIASMNNPQNFGLNRTNEGTLRFSWTDPTLAGIRLKPGDRFFEICFTVLDTVGVTQVFFSQEVLPFEFFDIDLNLYNIAAQNSTVYISNDPVVRPGDTNRDKIVNHWDLLNIGLGYGANGPERKNASLDWQNQLVGDWAATTPLSQLNYKHFDTDGNGLIEALDAHAIEVNWQRESQNLQPSDPIETREEGAPLYVKTNRITPGNQQVTFDIMLGEANNQAANVYGIAFSITYDALLENENVTATFDTSWLGKVREDLLVFQKNDAAAKRIDIALVRIDGANRSGFGTIGQLHFTVPAYTGETPTDTIALLPFRIENVRAIDALEAVQPTTPLETTAVVDISTGINNPWLAQKVRVFPNPAKEILHIRATDVTVENIILYNTNGQAVLQNSTHNSFAIESLEAGLYFCKILTDKGLITKRIAVVR